VLREAHDKQLNIMSLIQSEESLYLGERVQFPKGNCYGLGEANGKGSNHGCKTVGVFDFETQLHLKQQMKIEFIREDAFLIF
jgi:hypothetical protein